MKKDVITGANWDIQQDTFTQTFFDQNLSQFWRSEEIALSPDLIDWRDLPKEVQDAYNKNLQVLTFLDTNQGDIGMNVLSRAMEEEMHQRKALLNFMSAMENAVHAKSYSSIFMTYIDSPSISKLFDWGENNPNLQGILNTILFNYKELDKQVFIREYGDEYGITYDEELFNEIKWKFMVSSTFLESMLFYSGFYYPLYWYGQGKLMQAGEIINLILRDEAIHGLYIGLLAQETYSKFNKQKQEELSNWLYELLLKLFEDEESLIHEIYDTVGLSDDVLNFVQYNANKALMNLGFPQFFQIGPEDVNPVVINGLNTKTKTMDNFSMKGNGYQKMISEELEDEDFDFTGKRIALQ